MKSLFLFLLLISITANAQKSTATVDYIRYELLEDGNAIVISSPSVFDKYKGDIVIPQSIEVDGKTYAVTAIGDDAFDMCDELKSVEVMGTVKRIGAYAFSNSGLTTLVLHEEDALEAIGHDAFSGAFALSEFTIPASAEVEFPNFQRGEYDCGVKNIYVREGHPTLKDIDGVLFTKGDVLVRFPMSRQALYDIPNGTIGIGDRAFSNSRLSQVGIPESVEYIGNYAFLQSGIGEIDVPNGVKTVGDYAFSLCSNLIDVTFGEGVLTVGNGAFGASGVKKIVCTSVVPPVFIQDSYELGLFSTADPFLYVPEGCVDAYRDSPSWGALSTILEIGQSNGISIFILSLGSKPTYDLQGRHVAEEGPLRSGIYVRNGRKFVVK